MIIAQAVFLDIAHLHQQPNPFIGLEPIAMSVAFVLLVAGIVTSAWQHRNEPEAPMAIVMKAGFLTAFIAATPWLHTLLAELFYWPARIVMDGHGVNAVGDQLRAMTDTAMASQTGKFSFLNISPLKIATLATTAIMNIISAFASIIIIPFYYIMHALDLLGWTLMPIAIGAMSIPSLKHKAVSFVSATLSLFAWPLGFAIVNVIGGSVLMEIQTNPPPNEYGFLALMIGPFIVGTILILGTINVPLCCYFIFTSGSSHAGASASSGAAGQAANKITSVASNVLPK